MKTTNHINRPLGLALDIGTSGLRAQAIDLENHGRVVATALTERHPLPGVNVIDHLQFVLETGTTTAQRILVDAVNRLIGALDEDPVHYRRLAVCGNPVQLSLFQGLEIRDLVYAGQHKLQKLDITPPLRDACQLTADMIPNLTLASDATILIPPAVKHEVGADAIALVMETGLGSDNAPAIAIDYGTNAEMALAADGIVYTGSAAAGPALEGQHISHGMLALPGAICDLNPCRIDANTNESLWQTSVLDRRLRPRPGEVVALQIDKCHTRRMRPKGITGTGVVALLAEGIRCGLIAPPHINTTDNHLYLSEKIRFTTTDLAEAGKACGAIQAGILALCKAAGIQPDEIQIAYMAGAAGTFMDTLKARSIGLLPSHLKTTRQVGNTSLAAAANLVRQPQTLDRMQAIANRLRATHCMFASAESFKSAYLLSLSLWGEGLPSPDYRRFLKKFNLPDWKRPATIPPVVINQAGDITALGNGGLKIVPRIGTQPSITFDDCDGQGRCVEICPQHALSLHKNDDWVLTIRTDRCDGLRCRRCEKGCPNRALVWARFFSRQEAN